MIKDLGDKAFKYHIYVEHYDAALDLARGLGPEKTSSITFSKEPRISKEHLIQKDKKGIWATYIRRSILRDVLDPLVRRQQVE